MDDIMHPLCEFQQLFFITLLSPISFKMWSTNTVEIFDENSFKFQLNLWTFFIFDEKKVTKWFTPFVWQQNSNFKSYCFQQQQQKISEKNVRIIHVYLTTFQQVFFIGY